MKTSALVVSIALAAALAPAPGCAATRPAAPARPAPGAAPAARFGSAIPTAGLSIVNVDTALARVGRPVPDHALVVDSDSIASAEASGGVVRLTLTRGGRIALSRMSRYKAGARLALLRDGIVAAASVVTEPTESGETTFLVGAAGMKVLGLEAR